MVDHALLFLLELADGRIGPLRHLLAHICLLEIGLRRSQVFLLLLLSFGSQSFLTLVIDVTGLLGFLALFLQFLFKEEIIVRFQLTIYILTGLVMVLIDPELVLCDILLVSLSILLIDEVLAHDPLLLLNS